MSRLTRKGTTKIHLEDYLVNGRCIDIQDCLNKLGKLEDLEEQLGCPLEVVIEALKDGIYTKESELDKELELYDVRGIELKGLGVISKICSYGECDFTCYYTDYKKTWWLKKDKSE